MTPGNAESRVGEVTDLVIDLFAGPGGWSQAARSLGVREVGIEWDEAACRTAVAAGHLRIRADVSRYPTGHLRGKVKGLIISAPCTSFSAAGNGAGRYVMDVLHYGLRATLSGQNVVAECRTLAAREIRHQALRSRAKQPRAQRSAWARRQAFVSCLVLEVARWVRDTEPDWVACEQVPGVLPLWQTLARELRRHGYSTWAGVLNAADYGVPQTRQRAFLTASRTRHVTRPAPTHTRGGEDAPDLFGTQLAPWVSMADALGWGATDRPMPTVTSGGTATGGAEPIARGGRAALAESKRGGGLAVSGYRLARGAGMLERHGERRDSPVDEPAPVITSKARTATWTVTE